MKIFTPFMRAFVSVGAALVLTMTLISLNADDPAPALYAFFLGPWSSAWFFGNTLDYIALLLTASLAAALAIRGGVFNLGGEGQIYLGGLAAAVTLLPGNPGAEGVATGNIPGAVILCLAALAAMTAGGGMGFISGLLKKSTGANELITSFLLSAALTPMADYLISGPLRDTSGNLLAMPGIPRDRLLFFLLPPSSLSVSFICAILLVLAGHIFINKTAPGYRYRISGAAPDFARYGGINSKGSWIPVLTFSGALSGLAGFFAVAGTYGRCHTGFPGGLGWNAIAVALIARNQPLALFPAALVYGWLKAGADSSLLAAGMSLETSGFIQAVVLLLATVRFRRFWFPARFFTGIRNSRMGKDAAGKKTQGGRL
ncbi:MAG: ABC transporter permease [Treponema sp.]|jgi:simple sugar transport system permease protein|nr:ABC transporter permease [Treponema sp.]